MPCRPGHGARSGAPLFRPSSGRRRSTPPNDANQRAVKSQPSDMIAVAEGTTQSSSSTSTSSRRLRRLALDSRCSSPRWRSGTFRAHCVAICQETMRIAEISAAGQTACVVRSPSSEERLHKTRPTGRLKPHLSYPRATCRRRSGRVRKSAVQVSHQPAAARAAGSVGGWRCGAVARWWAPR